MPDAGMSDTPLNVLFVDDETRVLDGLRRQYHKMRHEWNMEFVSSGAAALELLKTFKADVVVSDMRMPEMNGAQLLQIVKQRWPKIIRLILSGQTDAGELISYIGAVHQYIQKPCEPSDLSRAISRSQTLARQLAAPQLQSAVASLQSLPVLNDTYQAFVRVVEDESCELKDVRSIVERDIGLSTKLLQLVNSAFFGLPRRVTTVQDAIVLLGIYNLKALVVTSSIVDALSDNDQSAALISELWRASTDIGALAGRLASKNGAPAVVRDSALLAGSLSLVGRAVLSHFWPDDVMNLSKQAREASEPQHELEAQAFGAPQHVVGAYALGLWAFEDSVVEAVANQLTPNCCQLDSPMHPVTFVHMARAQIGVKGVAEQITLDEDWVAKLYASSHPAD